MSIKMAIVGAGRMGSVLARKIPAETKKIIIDTDLDKAVQLAKEVNGVDGSALDDAKEADLIAIVLPAPAVTETVIKLLGIVKDGAIILNMATSAKLPPEIHSINTKVKVYDAKIIGHAMSISKGEPGIIVVNCEDEDRFNLIKSQLQGFHKVVVGDSNLVPEINVIGSTEGIRTAVNVKMKLEKMNIPDEWISVVIRTVCAGTMKSYTENDLGHFALELAQKLEAELR